MISPRQSLPLLGLVVGLSACATSSPPGHPATELAALLGVPESTRFLIIHGDDLAMTPAINSATIDALDRDVVTSASIIANGSWLHELGPVANRSVQPDLGVHLTVTSESTELPMAPILPVARVSTLVDPAGYLNIDFDGSPPAEPTEIESELRAQIARVRASGIEITHLDSHQGRLYSDSTTFAAFRRVARSECLPIRLARTSFEQSPYLADAETDGHFVLNDIVSIGPDVPPEDWFAFYEAAIQNLQPGVTEMVVHVGTDTDEERALFSAHPPHWWGADWRQRDVDVLSDPRFRELLSTHGVRLIAWGDLAPVLALCQPQS